MSKMKIGYQAVFFTGEEVTGRDHVRDTYEEAIKDIENEIDSVKDFAFNTFTHAKIDKVFYRGK